MNERSHLPLTPSMAGIQFAGWTPRAAASEGLGQRMLPDQAIPVDVDVSLHADVYLPEREGTYPAVVSFGGYNTDTLTAGIPSGSNEIGSPPVFTDRGYAPVIVERRGMGRSTGEQMPLFDQRDVDDHEKVIAWAAEQPWCNGQVVTFGTSYYAMTQSAVAQRKPPALKAMFCNEICTDIYRQIMYFGGVPASYFLGIWIGANFTEKTENTHLSPDRRAILSHLTNGPLHGVLEKAVHANVDKMFAKFLDAVPTDNALETYASWMFDAKTRQHPSVPIGLTENPGAIDVPFVVVQNLAYFNLHQYGAYDLFENSSTPPNRKWLILTPPAYDLPVYSWQGEALAFFDYILRGTDNGYDEQSPVRYWVDGAGRFATSDTFPPLRATTQKLFLGSEQMLSPEPTAPGSGSWAAVPIGVPVLGGLDEIAPQQLTFDLLITADTELAGAVTANLSFSCNEIDSYVVARLSRIDVDGTRHQLSMGSIRPAARTVDEPRSTSMEIAIDTGILTPLVPGKPVTLRFSLTPAPARLLSGETVQLDIVSRSDLLRLSPAEGWVHFDMPVPPYFSRNTLHFGGDSWIEIQLTRSSRANSLHTPPC